LGDAAVYGNATAGHPRSKLRPRGNREQGRLHGYGFVSNASPRNSANLCPRAVLREIPSCSAVAVATFATFQRWKVRRLRRGTGISKKLRSFHADRESASFGNSKNCRLHFKMANSPNLCTRAKAGLSRFAIGSVTSEFSRESSGIRDHQWRPVGNSENCCPTSPVSNSVVGTGLYLFLLWLQAGTENAPPMRLAGYDQIAAIATCLERLVSTRDAPSLLQGRSNSRLLAQSLAW
jgi:hypothetical protein